MVHEGCMVLILRRGSRMAAGILIGSLCCMYLYVNMSHPDTFVAHRQQTMEHLQATKRAHNTSTGPAPRGDYTASGTPHLVGGAATSRINENNAGPITAPDTSSPELLPNVASADYQSTLTVRMTEFEEDKMTPRAGSDRNRRILQTLQQQPDYDSLFYNVDIDTEINNSLIGGPLHRLDNFRNPCWVGRLPEGDPYRENQAWNISKAPQRLARSTQQVLRDFARRSRDSRDPWRMRCLPLVFTLGVSKSGTTDVFRALTRHLEVVEGPGENFYWDRWRTGGRTHQLTNNGSNTDQPGAVQASFSDYIDQFDVAAERIRQHSEGDYHRHVTVDPTASYLWLHTGWQNVPANRNLTEPRVILAHTLREFVPQAKFIVILRQPSARLYSHYHMFHQDGNPASFHAIVMTLLSNFQQCLETATVRSCVYNDTLQRRSPISGFRASFYHIFLVDWFQVFRREQFFVIMAEEYFSRRTPVLTRMFEFLDLAPMSDSWYAAQDANGVINSASAKGRLYAPMWAKTKRLLDHFFRPFNEQLADLLGDRRYISVWHPK